MTTLSTELDWYIADGDLAADLAGQAALHPGVRYEVVSERGPAGGHPVVRVTSDDSDAMRGALDDYCGSIPEGEALFEELFQTSASS